MSDYDCSGQLQSSIAASRHEHPLVVGRAVEGVVDGGICRGAENLGALTAAVERD